jgi:peptidoglycan/xylan/chitin deacetylase (PgdA/CDA1 family)
VLRGILALLAMMTPLCLSANGRGVLPEQPAPRRFLAGSRVSGELASQPADTKQGFAREPEARTQGQPSATFPRYLIPLPGEAPATAAHGPAERLVLLTFDDGPDLQGTPLILDELDRRKLRAVFFVMGQHIVRNRPEDLARRDLLRKLAVHGHHVGNHTMHHKDLCQNPGALAEEVDRAAELITYATGVRPLLFRSPYGARCRSLDRALTERDLTQVGWNADPQEWRGDSENAIFAYVTNRLAHASAPVILLLHDKNLAAAHALPRILDWIEKEEARVAREGGVPIRIVDYSVLLPEQTLSAQQGTSTLAPSNDAR